MALAGAGAHWVARIRALGLWRSSPCRVSWGPGGFGWWSPRRFGITRSPPSSLFGLDCAISPIDSVPSCSQVRGAGAKAPCSGEPSPIALASGNRSGEGHFCPFRLPLGSPHRAAGAVALTLARVKGERPQPCPCPFRSEKERTQGQQRLRGRAIGRMTCRRATPAGRLPEPAGRVTTLRLSSRRSVLLGD